MVRGNGNPQINQRRQRVSLLLPLSVASRLSISSFVTVIDLQIHWSAAVSCQLTVYTKVLTPRYVTCYVICVGLALSGGVGNRCIIVSNPYDALPATYAYSLYPVNQRT